MKVSKVFFSILLTVLLALIGAAVFFMPAVAAPMSQDSPPAVEYSQEAMLALAGAAISLAFSYIPGLRTRFAKLSDETKKLIMAGVLAGVTAAVVALSCYGWISTSISCTRYGLERVLMDFLIMAAVNQGVYKLTPAARDVREVKGMLIVPQPGETDPGEWPGYPG